MHGRSVAAARHLCAPAARPRLQVKYAVNTETGEKVAIKILDKEKIQKQNMGAQIKKEVRIPPPLRVKRGATGGGRAARSAAACPAMGLSRQGLGAS